MTENMVVEAPEIIIDGESDSILPEIIIDEEFQSILPVLDKTTYASLEENLLQNGCVYPLVLWNGSTLIDGHNRYEICMKHGIPFSTVTKEFSSRDAVLIWIVENQIARRNLNPTQLTYYRGLHYRTDKKIVTNDKGKNQFSEVEAQNGPQPKDTSTATRLAKQYKVSRNTIKRDAKVSEAIDAIGMTSPEAKKSILSGETRITKKHLNELIGGTGEAITETAVKIGNGTFENKRPVNSAPVDDDGFDDGGLDDGGSDVGYDADRSDDGTDDPALTGLNPVNAAIIKLSDDFNSDARRLATGNDATELKTTIRSFIAALEDLYVQL